MQTPAPQDYLKCAKGGLHDQESLNLVCLETSCSENALCCCACVEVEHRRHKTRPLRMVMAEARHQAASLDSNRINMDILLDMAQEQQRLCVDLFQKYRREILTSLDGIERALQGYFSHTIDQILLRNSDCNMMIEEALQRAAAPKNLDDLRITVKKLVAMVREGSGKGAELTEDQMKQSLQDSSESVLRSIEGAMQQVNSRLCRSQQVIASLINNTSLWHVSYKFAGFRHPDIKLVSESRVKASNNSGYKFAVMEPGVGKVTKKTFSFAVRESTSNWLAVGLCHLKVVESKKYSFVFGAIGHGAYMISSNGGSWSHSKAEHNNTVKAIKFGKGDTVHVTIDQPNSKIIFCKNSSSESYELPYEDNEGDPLHPCVLFYYINDEVQYVGSGKS